MKARNHFTGDELFHRGGWSAPRRNAGVQVLRCYDKTSCDKEHLRHVSTGLIRLQPSVTGVPIMLQSLSISREHSRDSQAGNTETKHHSVSRELCPSALVVGTREATGNLSPD